MKTYKSQQRLFIYIKYVKSQDSVHSTLNGAILQRYLHWCKYLQPSHSHIYTIKTSQQHLHIITIIQQCIIPTLYEFQLHSNIATYNYKTKNTQLIDLYFMRKMWFQ